MTFAAIISFSILLIISYVTFIPTYFEIASVVLFGLIADLFTTWLGNTSMVLSPDSEFFNYLKSDNGAAAAASE